MVGYGVGAGVAAIAALVVAGGAAQAAPAPPRPVEPGLLPPPDPRRGEAAQGLEVQPRRPPSLARLILTPPRAAVQGIDVPIFVTIDEVERHRVLQRLHDLLTSEDGLVGVRPVAELQLGAGAQAGARLFDR